MAKASKASKATTAPVVPKDGHAHYVVKARGKDEHRPATEREQRRIEASMERRRAKGAANWGKQSAKMATESEQRRSAINSTDPKVLRKAAIRQGLATREDLSGKSLAEMRGVVAKNATSRARDLSISGDIKNLFGIDFHAPAAQAAHAPVANGGNRLDGLKKAQLEAVAREVGATVAGKATAKSLRQSIASEIMRQTHAASKGRSAELTNLWGGAPKAGPSSGEVGHAARLKAEAAVNAAIDKHAPAAAVRSAASKAGRATAAPAVDRALATSAKRAASAVGTALVKPPRGGKLGLAIAVGTSAMAAFQAVRPHPAQAQPAGADRTKPYVAHTAKGDRNFAKGRKITRNSP